MGKRKASQRQLPDAPQTPKVLRRRSSRMRSSPSILGSRNESRAPLQQRPIPSAPHLIAVTSMKRKLSIDPAEKTAIQGPRAHAQDNLRLPVEKRGPEGHVEATAERPLKRARLTAENLKVLEKEMGGLTRESVGKKSDGQSSTMMTTDKDLDTKLQQSGLISTIFDAGTPDDCDEIGKLVDRLRDSEPPDQSDYERYLRLTDDCGNEDSVEIYAFLMLSKRVKKLELLVYSQRPNHIWSAIDNHLTPGHNAARPDVVESYRRTDFPPSVIKALSRDLSISTYNETMPAYTVESKNVNIDMIEAILRCVYDEALMAEGVRTIREHLGTPDANLYGKTQALTVTFNAGAIKFFGHHAVPVARPSQSTASDAIAALQYHRYLHASDIARDSFESFQSAYKHIRNAEDLVYKLATKQKDALWVRAKADKIYIGSKGAEEPIVSSGHHDGLVKQSLALEDWSALSDALVSTPTSSLLPSQSVSLPLESQKVPVSVIMA